MPIGTKYLNLPNRTTFPIPEGGLGWKLIHTPTELTQGERQYLASIIEAYEQLIMCTQQERNQTISMIRMELKKNAKL